jgi:hypothetical protein
LVGQFGIQGAHVRAYRVVMVAVHRLGAEAPGAVRAPEPEHLVDDASLRVGEILEGGPRLIRGDRFAGWELPGHVDLDVQFYTGVDRTTAVLDVAVGREGRQPGAPEGVAPVQVGTREFLEAGSRRGMAPVARRCRHGVPHP